MKSFKYLYGQKNNGSMGILDQLIEKKNLMIYIDMRIRQLEKEMEKEVGRQPPRKRGLMVQKFRGRVEELRSLKAIVANNKVKERAISTWRNVNPRSALYVCEGYSHEPV
jgi:hypothetical protein